MKCKPLHLLVFAGLLAAVSAQAADYVKVSGADVDFYYDADVWTNGVSVTGNTIVLQPGDSYYQRQDVTEGASDPYLGPLYSAGVDFSQSYTNGLIAVAHAGYYLTNDISGSGAAVLEASGFNGGASYGLHKSYSSGSYSGGVFTASEEIGYNDEFAYFWHQWYNSGSDSGQFPLILTTTQTLYSVIAASGSFTGVANTEGLGTAAAGLNSVTYSFSVTPVPEADQYILLTGGLILLAAMARRRRASMP